jgi:hypothetical protein
MLDLNALSTPVNKCFPLDPASLEEAIEKEKKATDNIFYVHAELVETASVLFLRQIASGHSSIAAPGEDREVIQLLRLPRQTGLPENLVLLPSSSTSSRLPLAAPLLSTSASRTTLFTARYAKQLYDRLTTLTNKAQVLARENLQFKLV